jgi:hypothetical protein
MGYIENFRCLCDSIALVPGFEKPRSSYLTQQRTTPLVSGGSRQRANNIIVNYRAKRVEYKVLNI